MPEMSKDDVFKVEVLTTKEFCALHGDVKPEAIYYAIREGLVDYIPLGREKFIVMTNHTRQYKPNQSKKRPVAPKKKKALKK